MTKTTETETAPPTPLDPTTVIRDGLRAAIQVYQSRLKALAKIKGARQLQIFTAEELDPARASLSAWLFRAGNAYARHLSNLGAAGKKLAQHWGATADPETAKLLLSRIDVILVGDELLSVAFAGEAAFPE